ncbi:hypothetical protein WEI85_09990 [Actinomycetes bacterium KLBMP 9797]
MTQPSEITEEQARELIARLLGAEAEVALHPFDVGWLAQEILPEQDRARGMHIGQGSYIVDRTGVVTVHASLPVPVVIEEYRVARRQGRTTGRQVWPSVEG